MPVGIEIIEGEIGYWNIVGVNLGGKFIYDVVAQMFGLFYVGYIAAGFQFLFCLAIMKKDLSFLFDFVCNFGQIAFGCFFWINYGDDVNMSLIQRITFQYHLIPLFAFLDLILLLFKNRKYSKKQKLD